jgi:hypothetical protein
MNKAFGEMFLAIDHEIIALREDEIPDGLSSPIVIPSHFRMVCTMNDYDKSLLNDLSYGLLRRFAFVEIRIPNDKEELKSVVKERVIDDLSGSNSFLEGELHKILGEVDEHINKLIDLVYAIRNSRELGVSIIIDIISYIVSRNMIEKENDNWKLLNEEVNKIQAVYTSWYAYIVYSFYNSHVRSRVNFHMTAFSNILLIPACN